MKHALKLKTQKLKVKTKQKKYSNLISWVRACCNKLFPTFISSLPYHKKVFWTAGRYTLYIAICVFLLLNIILSQLLSPIYFQMMNENQKAFISYLQSIRNLSQFSSDLSRLKNIYGSGLETSVYNKEIEEKIMIQNLEQELQKSPYSRDILYSLFFLYDQKGDKKIAQEYFEQARMVDPMVK